MKVKPGTEWRKVLPNAGWTSDFRDGFIAKARGHLDTIGNWDASIAQRLNNANVNGSKDGVRGRSDAEWNRDFGDGSIV
ncbi:hypothetical protein DPMN_013152 [Dreissena polymorpha]|uniref:Uncharacterized protein n=1 Tax=Dreissena polymorpha TaxID=45954 RepID=A0A9D4N747_DREPO|nr:hypothetical protein DPMN_013152 [Dreissena polymorpha]